MIELQQNENNLIGSKEAIAELENTDHARILVASDSHNHFDILLEILRQFGPGCNAFAFCGDGLGDIATIFSLATKDEEIRKILPPVIAFVAGNCDPSFYPTSVSTNEQLVAPPRQILNVNGHKIMIVHGHRESVDFSFNKLGLEMKLSNCKTGLYGHTHIAEETIIKNSKFINPGSCSTPRGGQPQSFAILTVEKKFIDTAFIMINQNDDNRFKIWRPN